MMSRSGMRDRPPAAGGGATSSTAASASGTASSAEQEERLLEGHADATLRRRTGRSRVRASGSSQSSPVLTRAWRAPARASRAARVRSVRLDRGGEALAEARIGRVDQPAAAGLEVAQLAPAPRAGRSRSRRSRTSMAMISWRRPRPPSACSRPGWSGKSEMHHHGAAVARDAAERRDGAGQVGARAGGPGLGRAGGRPAASAATRPRRSARGGRTRSSVARAGGDHAQPVTAAAHHHADAGRAPRGRARAWCAPRCRRPSRASSRRAPTRSARARSRARAPSARPTRALSGQSTQRTSSPSS